MGGQVVGRVKFCQDDQGRFVVFLRLGTFFAGPQDGEASLLSQSDLFPVYVMPARQMGRNIYYLGIQDETVSGVAHHVAGAPLVCVVFGDVLQFKVNLLSYFDAQILILVAVLFNE